MHDQHRWRCACRRCCGATEPEATHVRMLGEPRARAIDLPCRSSPLSSSLASPCCAWAGPLLLLLHPHAAANSRKLQRRFPRRATHPQQTHAHGGGGGGRRAESATHRGSMRERGAGSLCTRGETAATARVLTVRMLLPAARAVCAGCCSAFRPACSTAWRAHRERGDNWRGRRSKASATQTRPLRRERRGMLPPSLSRHQPRSCASYK